MLRALLPITRPLLLGFFALSTLVLLTHGLFLNAAPVTAKPEGEWPSVSLQEIISAGLVKPVHITHAGDGSWRLFIVEQDGRIRIYQNGALLATPFLNIGDRVRSTGDEEGLLSVAFPPDYATKRYFYVYYVNNPGDLVIARFHVPAATPNQANPHSEQILLTIPHPGFSNHNGGQLAFGQDGYLYIGTGDGGGGGDPNNNGQNPATLLGKMLRLDVESPAGSATYLVPSTNPFVGNPAVQDEIWALGLRNPWRFSFDRATGALYIADVGQNQLEEINVQAASSAGGENYGWRCYEGTLPYNTTGCGPQSQYTFPVYEYGRALGCSVTGGHVYRGAAHSALSGIYLYTDYCSGRIWGLRQGTNVWENHEFLAAGFGISSFGEDEAGEIYAANRSNGRIYRLAGPTPTYSNFFYLPLLIRDSAVTPVSP
jgi:glucose/arabinose dehydrogenase